MNDNEHKLGLPLEYQKMPEYFDAHNISEETEAKNALIEKLLRKQNVKSVLDMTCGTGSQVFYLAKRGYDVVGSDFNPALLAIARKKAKALNRNIVFIDGDMRELQAGKFDAVITIFNAIGHLTKADFERALQNIHANLKEDGVYIFDIFNLQAITDDIIDDFAMDIENIVNGDHIRNIQHSEIDREKGLLTSHDRYIISKEHGEQKTYTNSFSLQIYTAEELQTTLKHSGFEIINQYDMDGNDFIADKSLNILTVARKKKAW
ncbi:class I SAM-dependent methyltransferase [Legionella pneumophila]|uniref:class I SAM-dependent methyltransferase n=1 Tax=Legionella pneumophila TaxID=446 RepID=UPI0004B1578E|nr:class I SAM-dependent methyltransferase [Legionella pneumophila]RYB40215.1 class I SAM-dependent methyltransferase [Legionella pneumophila]RYW28536.1 class I SAM-dependent methyltransferase [Legionella pneumophila]HAT1867348.1 class I SAM-dependent methyltransferase [Legionella pneumophila]HAT1907475.1 class I SAM-dependent methyltransferase [Legionella pneumophila]HAT1916840.1 class I SAM-dependent methyltransferase [Legionella pneumophila]